ncbi:hypothetical protein BH10PLA1_BH10PLA1_06200 [soil metagenome]
MSILLAGDVVTPSGWVMLIALSAAAIVALQRSGVFGKRDVPSIGKLFRPLPVGPLVYNAGLAIFVYVAAALAIGMALRMAGKIDTSSNAEQTMSPGVLILFSVVVPMITLLGLLFGLRFIVPGGPPRLGLTREQLGRAFLPAAGFVLAAMPFIFLIANAAEWIYERVGWQHDTEHPLLTSMGASGGLIEKVCGVLAAVVLAPLSEEILFRGHLQTVLRHLFSPKQPASPAVIEAMSPVPSPSEADALAPIFNPPPAPPGSDSFPSPIIPNAKFTIASIAAVLMTSTIFAWIHPDWSRPPIFVLAVFLGLAYERRGNLWTCIFMHALFNGIMVTLFLFMAHRAA